MNVSWLRPDARRTTKWLRQGIESEAPHRVHDAAMTSVRDRAQVQWTVVRTMAKRVTAVSADARRTRNCMILWTLSTGIYGEGTTHSKPVTESDQFEV